MKYLLTFLFYILTFSFCFPNNTKLIIVSSNAEKYPKYDCKVVASLQQAFDILRMDKDSISTKIILDEGKHLIEKTLVLKDLNKPLAIEAKEKGLSCITGEKLIDKSILRYNDSIISFPHNKEIYKLIVDGKSVSLAASVKQSQPQNMKQFSSFQSELENNTYSAIFEKEEINKMEVGCYVYIYCKWIHYKLKVVSVDEHEQRVYMNGMTVNVNYIKNNKDVYYSICNSRKILQPGTFCNLNDTVYYHSQEDDEFPNIEIRVPHLINLLEISNCKRGILIEGIHFTGAVTNSLMLQEPQAGVNWPQAVVVKKSETVIFDDCEFSNNMGYSINIKNNSEECVIRNCFFHELGCGAIRVGENHYSDETHHITITNNLIKGYGNVNASAVGILVAKANNITVINNTVCDGYYTGISLGWTWGYGKSYSYGNYVANNHIHHLMQCLMSDGAGIYTLGKQEGTIIENNYIHDIVSRVFSAAGSSLIYFDEGTSDVIARNNVCFGSHTGFHEHYGKCNLVEDNVFAYTNQITVRLSNYKMDSLLTVRNNTFIVDCGVAFNPNMVRHGIIDNNKFWSGELIDSINGMRTINDSIKIRMTVKSLYSKNVIKQKFAYGVSTKKLKKKSNLSTSFLNAHNDKVNKIFPVCSSYFRKKYK